MSSERREYKRVAARLQATLFDKKGNKRVGLMRNISGGGVALECDFSVNKDVILTIEFVLPVENLFKTIKASVKVVNLVYRGSVQKMAIGFEFQALEPQFVDYINIYAKDRTAM